MNKVITETMRLREVSQAVCEIWYSYAEGFLPKLTGTAQDDKLYQLIDARMPRGWTASIQPSGSVYATCPVFVKRKSLGVLVVEKRSDGHQRIFEIAL
ncbi:hypothetical protein NZD89_25350 [Alicyclobacillus fastidiosus]|uniref:Uncharacterized protein n=1 Tax=Alicyclobacillus fastidiosus TaxID=392011 RepID=A0ABY6ZHY1_9BACL|nr:hypothetical protein [Alicyclobacillus fastidiosus]WAH41525.1 hypothetical protein NZD89_25350 [Alicyclobacillus fastidiosus]